MVSFIEAAFAIIIAALGFDLIAAFLDFEFEYMVLEMPFLVIGLAWAGLKFLGGVIFDILLYFCNIERLDLIHAEELRNRFPNMSGCFRIRSTPHCLVLAAIDPPPIKFAEKPSMDSQPAFGPGVDQVNSSVKQASLTGFEIEEERRYQRIEEWRQCAAFEQELRYKRIEEWRQCVALELRKKSMEEQKNQIRQRQLEATKVQLILSRDFGAGSEPRSCQRTARSSRNRAVGSQLTMAPPASWYHEIR